MMLDAITMKTATTIEDDKWDREFFFTNHRRAYRAPVFNLILLHLNT